MKERVVELDYLKCILILLMVLFHLAYFSEIYPLLKQFVYAFHMPVFLILSGYLTNINKGFKKKGREILWLFIPYSLMEASYVVMASILPIREHLDGLSIELLIRKVLMEPMGPYWYLHTLLVCQAMYYVVFLLKKIKPISRFFILAVCLFLLSRGNFKLLVFINAMYFIIGVWMRQSNFSFLLIFQASFWAILPLCILCYNTDNFGKSEMSGIAITYLATSLILETHKYIPGILKKVTYFIGKNTLVILLFSPIFTFLSKLLIPLFAFDKTGICFATVSVFFVIIGCFAISYIMDYFQLSRFFVGRERILNRTSN
ncbi:acyltransferase family protein [Bacteroides pyogenes]|uniref:acyltransferase family protein n=1 Tax=Bacteroides pyogenes TaxID=310300 RepID=UPI001F3E79B2|nr:acyltransferase [Bacteroides pyogenes]MCF2707870.1 acyltransferase [Bacteroides pyogenes]